MSEDVIQIKHNSKCDGCFYKVKYNFGNLALCNRDWNMNIEESVDACKSPGPCKYYITPEEINRMVKTFFQNPN